MSDPSTLEELLARIAEGASARAALDGRGDEVDPEIRAAAGALPSHDDSAENLAAWAATGLATDAELAQFSDEDHALVTAAAETSIWLSPADPDAPPPPPAPSDVQAPASWSAVVAAAAALAACLALGLYFMPSDGGPSVSEQVDPSVAATSKNDREPAAGSAVPEKAAPVMAAKPEKPEPEKPEPEKPAEPEMPGEPAADAPAKPRALPPPRGRSEDAPPPPKPAAAAAPKPAAATAPRPKATSKPKRGKSEVDDLLGALDGNSGGSKPAARASKPAAAPQPAGDPALPRNLNRRQILTVIKKSAGGVRSCKDRSPGGGGTISVAITIAPSGRVSGAKAKGKYAGTPLGACVESKVRALRFPQFGGAPMAITMPFGL